MIADKMKLLEEENQRQKELPKEHKPVDVDVGEGLASERAKWLQENAFKKEEL